MLPDLGTATAISFPVKIYERIERETKRKEVTTTLGTLFPGIISYNETTGNHGERVVTIVSEAGFNFVGYYIDFGGERVMLKNIVEQKEWWKDLHLRHTIRIYGSIILLLVGIGDFVLNIFGMGYWDIFSDFIWIIGSFGMLGASTYLAIDANGK